MFASIVGAYIFIKLSGLGIDCILHPNECLEAIIAESVRIGENYDKIISVINNISGNSTEPDPFASADEYAEDVIRNYKLLNEDNEGLPEELMAYVCGYK